MKRFIVLVTMIIAAGLGGLYASSTVTSDAIYRKTFYVGEVSLTITVDMNDADFALGDFQGKVTGITIFEASGADINFAVYLTDEDDFDIFSKTDCNTLEMPHRYAVSAGDTGTTRFIGVPVSGDLTVSIVDANDGSLSALTVKVYYDEARP